MKILQSVSFKAPFNYDKFFPIRKHILSFTLLLSSKTAIRVYFEINNIEHGLRFKTDKVGINEDLFSMLTTYILTLHTCRGNCSSFSSVSANITYIN